MNRIKDAYENSLQAGIDKKVKIIKSNTLITFALAVTTIAMVTGILGATMHLHPAFASQDAYSRGQRDAIRDYHGLNGHGFDDSCPSGHSTSYCSNYHDGYSTQWAVSSNSDMQNGGDGTGHTESTQSGAIGGNDVSAGDHSEVNINQFLNQRDNSPQSDVNNDNSDHNGDLSNCKAFCVN